jgi:hypothetical protein
VGHLGFSSWISAWDFLGFLMVGSVALLTEIMATHTIEVVLMFLDYFIVLVACTRRLPPRLELTCHFTAGIAYRMQIGSPISRLVCDYHRVLLTFVEFVKF